LIKIKNRWSVLYDTKSDICGIWYFNQRNTTACYCCSEHRAMYWSLQLCF